MHLYRLFFCAFLLTAANVSFAQTSAAPSSPAISPTVQAATEPDPKFFKDFTGVTALLRANGVEPSRLQWGVIETVCTPFHDYENPIPYNRCRFEKGRDQSWSGNDARNCDDQAAGQYPDTLVTGDTTNILRYRNGISSTTTIQNPTMSQADLNAARAGAYDKCMTGKGWRDSHNYLSGRTN